MADTVILTVRVEPGLKEALARLQQQLEATIPGLRVSQNEAHRLALLRGLEAEGIPVDAAPPPSSGRPRKSRRE